MRGTDGTSGSGTVRRRDLLTEVAKDLEIDPLDFEAALIFDRAAGPQ